MQAHRAPGAASGRMRWGDRPVMMCRSRRTTARAVIPVLAEADSFGDSHGGGIPNQCRGVTNRMGAGLMGARLEITRRDHTSTELRALSGRCCDGAQVRRLLALALVLEGHSRTEAARLSGMDRQTLRDWVDRKSTRLNSSH